MTDEVARGPRILQWRWMDSELRKLMNHDPVILTDEATGIQVKVILGDIGFPTIQGIVHDAKMGRRRGGS